MDKNVTYTKKWIKKSLKADSERGAISMKSSIRYGVISTEQLSFYNVFI